VIPVEIWGLALTLPPTAALMAFSSWVYNRHIDQLAAQQLAFQERQDRERDVESARRQKAKQSWEAQRQAREPERARRQAQEDQKRDARHAASRAKYAAADALAARLADEGLTKEQYDWHQAPKSPDYWYRWRQSKTVVSEWLQRHVSGTEYQEQLARSQGVERQILMLDLNEKAVLILLHGLLDGTKVDPEQVAARLGLRASSVRSINYRALIKVDLLQIHSLDDDLTRYVWWEQGNCWFKCWYADSEWPQRKRQPAPSRDERSAMMARSRSWITFYHSGKFGIAADDDDPAADQSAASIWFVSRSGATTPWLPGEVGHESIDAVETANELQRRFQKLSNDERQVVSMTWGIGTAGVFSTAEIAAALDLTALQTRQIELTAMAKLRATAKQYLW
jgi:hypothetical protein